MADTVTAICDGFVAMGEFNGSNDACMVVAEMAALNVCPWRGDMAMNAATEIAWRNQYLAARKWTFNAQGQPEGGTTLANGYWHLTQIRKAHIAGYIPYAKTPNVEALHTFVKYHAFRKNPIIIQVRKAHVLPKNEQGVFVHFVTIGGGDSDRGYLLANSDTVDALRNGDKPIPTYWASWSTLVAADICGAIALDRGWQAPAPIPTPGPDAATIAQAVALIDQAVALLK